MGIPFFYQNIMIAFYELNMKIAEIVSPFPKKIKFFICNTMKQVADNNQLLRLIILQLVDEPLHIFFINALRNGDG